MDRGGNDGRRNRGVPGNYARRTFQRRSFGAVTPADANVGVGNGRRRIGIHPHVHVQLHFDFHVWLDRLGGVNNGGGRRRGRRCRILFDETVRSTIEL